jgi:hypothetical protein
MLQKVCYFDKMPTKYRVFQKYLLYGIEEVVGSIPSGSTKSLSSENRDVISAD